MLTRRLVTALPYYVGSVPLLVGRCRNPLALLRLASRSGAPVMLELRDGSRYLLRTLLDAWVLKETVLDRVYEPSGRSIEPDWTIVDVGAGLGDFTVDAARRAPRGRVDAYEPARGSAALLLRNLGLNGIANVTVYEEAVAAESGEVVLDESVPEPVMVKLSRATAESRGRSVPAVTLEQVLERLPDRRCDLLKMDCEGAELDILLGADRAVLDRVVRVSLEYHDFDHAGRHRQLIDRLRSFGRTVEIQRSAVYQELGYLYSERVEPSAAAPAHARRGAPAAAPRLADGTGGDSARERSAVR